MKKEIKKSWVVTMECIIKKEIVTDECTESEARNNTWSHVLSEQEMGMNDWEVLKVEENI